MENNNLKKTPPEIYDEYFLPAIFSLWPSRIIKLADIKAGDNVLDVATGTGVLAKSGFETVAPDGSVVGLDPTDGMLAIARKKSSEIKWVHGVAEEIPFEDNHFDAVVSQFGMMFFVDREKALQEMFRVLKQGGKLVVAVWASLEETPGYNLFVQVLDRLFGRDIANELIAPFNLGDSKKFESHFINAGFSDYEIKTVQGSANFKSVDEWVYMDIKGWTLADKIDNTQYALLLEEMKKNTAQFTQENQTIKFDMPAHIAIFQK